MHDRLKQHLFAQLVLATCATLGTPAWAQQQQAAPLAGSAQATAGDDSVKLDPEAQRLETAMNSALQVYTENLQRAADGAAPREDEVQPHVTTSGTLRWDRRSMDIPQVTMTMRRRDLSFGAPEVTMRARSISFDVPETRMERREVACTPRTTVDTSRFPPRVTVWCQPNFINVPVITMVTKRIATNVPEVTMQKRSIGVSLPESRVEMKRISWNWPELVNDCSAVNSKACRENGDHQKSWATGAERRLNRSLGEARQQGAREASKQVTAFFTYQREGLQRQNAAMGDVLKTTVAQMEAALRLMQAQGGENTPEAEETRASLATIQRELPAEMAKILHIIEELKTAEAAIITGLSDSPQA